MKKIINQRQKNDSKCSRRQRVAFSIMEILCIVAVVGTLCGVGIATVVRTKEAGEATKLASDVRTLNAGMRLYLSNGGQVPPGASGEEVIALLKTTPSAEQAGSLVGVRGPFIDLRLRGVAADKDGPMRAVWDEAVQKFVLKREGEGFVRFELDDRAAEVGTDDRHTMHRFASVSGWVWDHATANAAPSDVLPQEAATTLSEPGVYSPPPAPRVPALLAPVAKPYNFAEDADGLYTFMASAVPGQQARLVQLEDPNPEGAAKLFYRLNDQEWKLYEGPFPLEIKLDNVVETYAASTNTEKWEDSRSAERVFKTIYFQGTSDGYFFGPEGDVNLVTNLAIGLGDILDGVLAGPELVKGTRGPKGLINSRYFDWGEPHAGPPRHTRRNSVEFLPQTAGFFVPPGEEFELGEITYYNSTTNINTNATEVQVRVTLNLLQPKAMEKLYFKLNLLSRQNFGRSEDEDADYIEFVPVQSNFQGAVQGKTFRLELRFGPSDPNVGFSTGTAFNVHETKGAAAKLYGKLVPAL